MFFGSLCIENFVLDILGFVGLNEWYVLIN